MSKAILVVLVVILFTMPLAAHQTTASQPRAASNKVGAPAAKLAFETLLSQDSYEFYGEVRSFAQLWSCTDFLEPVMKLGIASKELKLLTKVLRSNVESLTSSRLMFAAWPARKGLPEIFIGVEMPSPADAEKLEAKLMPVLAPTPERSLQLENSKSQSPATIMAAFLYNTAMRDERLPRKTLGGQ